MSNHVHLHEVSEERVSDDPTFRNEAASRMRRMRSVICRGFHKREEVADRGSGPQPASHMELEKRAMGSSKAGLDESPVGIENSIHRRGTRRKSAEWSLPE
jgi:hypothetical protein